MAEPSPEGKSILVLVTGTQRRGAEVFGESLARGLRERGWDSHLLALRDTGAAERIDAAALFTPETAIGLAGLNLRVVRRLRATIRELGPSVVFAGGGATLKYSVAALLAWRGRPKLVYSSIGEPVYWAKGPSGRAVLRWLLRRADMVTAVSRATSLQLSGVFRVPPGKLRVAHTGVPRVYLEVAGDPPTEVLRILFLGSLSFEKDPVGAVSAVKAMHEQATLRIVGDGPLMAEVRSAAGESPRIEIMGATADVTQHLKWADVLLLTSRTEGLPGAVLEAAAAGVPAIAFGVGGVGEAIADGESGIVVTPGMFPEVTEALDRVARDRGALDAMSARARDRVREEFLMAHAVTRYDRILGEAISAR